MALPNPLESFVWGAGGAQLSPEQLAQRRKVEDALLARGVDTSPVGHWTQGLARVADALAGSVRRGQLDDAEAANAGYNATQNERMARGGLTGFPAAPTGASGGFPAAPGSSAAPIDLSGDKETFVSSLMPAAMEASQRTGVDPRIIVAQAAQETGWGKHAPGNNYFGIKSHGQGGGQNLATTEYVNGKPVRVNDSFRGYASPADSVSGYADFLLQNPRYKPMMGAQGLDAQLAALGASGYATDPNYASSVGAIARGLPMPSAVAANDAMATGQPIPAAPVQVASNDPSIGMVTPATQADDGGLQVGGPADTTDRSSRVVQALMNPQSMTGGAPMPMRGGQAPQQVAQAAPAPSGQDLSQIPVMAGGTAGALPPGQASQGINPAIIEALSNPAASEQTRKIAGLLLGQQMEAQQQANDPLRQLQIEKARREMQMGQPLINAGSGAVYNPNTGEWLTSPNSAKDKLPAAVQEYEYAKGQGFPGTFQDWEASKKGGMSLQVDPATGAVTFQQGSNIKPMTEGQSKDTTFAVRAEGALPIIDKFGNALTSFPESAASSLPGGIGNYAQSPEYQQAQQAGTEFLQAILRKDTGAAITPQETAEYGKVYLPRPGDGPEVLAQKQVSRRRALEALKAGMTPQAILAQEKALEKVGSPNAPKKPAAKIDGYTIEEVE